MGGNNSRIIELPLDLAVADECDGKHEQRRANHPTPGGSFPKGECFQARRAARAIDHWVGRSAVGYQFHALLTAGFRHRAVDRR